MKVGGGGGRWQRGTEVPRQKTSILWVTDRGGGTTTESQPVYILAKARVLFPDKRCLGGYCLVASFCTLFGREI